MCNCYNYYWPSKFGFYSIWQETLLRVFFVFLTNLFPSTHYVVMRVASNSKPLSAVALLQLHQQGKVDLDAPIQTYVPSFPRKKYHGKEVELTVRMLMAHLAGIRGYKKEGKRE